MSEAAIAETETETEAEVTEVTEGVTATDPANPVQTESTANPVLEAIKRGDEADFDARVKEEAARLARQDKVEKRSETYRKNVANRFNQTISELVAEIGPEFADKIWTAANKLHLGLNEEAVAPVREEYEEWLESFIPEADLSVYRKETEGKSTDAKFKLAAEYLVPSTKAIKAMTLDQFAEHSTKGRSELKAQLKAAEEEGYQRGLKAPAGDPTGNGTKQTAVTTGYKTKSEARAMRVQGLIDNTELRNALSNPNLPN